MSPEDRQILELSTALGLEYQRQDWGIINANPDRVMEFLQFCEASTLTPAQEYAMVELILASMNALLTKEKLKPETVSAFSQFLGKQHNGLSTQLDYWSALNNDSGEFPIIELLYDLHSSDEGKKRGRE
jgi:hypothetical protein